ncbi:MAG: MarR family transcriptional regulator [Puniceicoccaceae bacterium]|nr:MAG: MarR family transcriptional regulator [Puniceicoccaceae bacterium]
MAKIYQHSGPHLFLLLWRASHAVMRFDEKGIQQQGFASLSDYAVLEVLLHRGPLPVNTIGEKVLLTSGSMTTAVHRLEKKGLVRRERSEGDGRVVLVHLTDSGRACIETAFEAHARSLDALFEKFTKEERAQFAGLVTRLGRRAKQMTEQFDSGT